VLHLSKHTDPWPETSGTHAECLTFLADYYAEKRDLGRAGLATVANLRTEHGTRLLTWNNSDEMGVVEASFGAGHLFKVRFLLGVRGEFVVVGAELPGDDAQNVSVAKFAVDADRTNEEATALCMDAADAWLAVQIEAAGLLLGARG